MEQGQGQLWVGGEGRGGSRGDTCKGPGAGGRADAAHLSKFRRTRARTALTEAGLLGIDLKKNGKACLLPARLL